MCLPGRNVLLHPLAVPLTLALLAGCTAAPPVDDAGTGGPSIVLTIPGDGAAQVTSQTAIVVSFSQPVRSASLSLTPQAQAGAPSFDTDRLEARWESVSLQPGVTYTVAVSAEGDDGSPLTGTSQFSFTTAAQVDVTAPSLASSNPADGAMDVASNTILELTFSEPMEAESLVTTFEPVLDPGTPNWNGAGTVASFSGTASQLQPGVSYTLKLEGTDRAGNALGATSLSFTVALPADTEAPAIASTSPSADAVQVPSAAAIAISFSEPMNQGSVDGAFSIAPAVAGVTLWDTSGTLRSFQPSSPLAASTQYTVTLGTGAQDLAGNALAAPASFTFTTAAAPDTTAPTLVSSNPELGAKGVARAIIIELTFSEPMDKASTQSAFDITLPVSANTGLYSWSADGKTMRFNSAGVFDYGTTVAWRLTTTARDLAGNTVPQQVTRSFQIIRSGTLVIDSTAALDGYVTNGGAVSTLSSFLPIGDNAANVAQRSFLSFDLQGLPMTVTAITSAQLYLYLASVSGDPVGLLGGGPRLERLRYGGTLQASAYDAAPFTQTGDLIAFTASTTLGWKSGSAVLAAVRSDWAERAMNGDRFQLRMKLPNQLAANGAADAFAYYSGNTGATTCDRPASAAPGSSCKPHLVVTYEYP